MLGNISGSAAATPHFIQRTARLSSSAIFIADYKVLGGQKLSISIPAPSSWLSILHYCTTYSPPPPPTLSCEMAFEHASWNQSLLFTFSLFFTSCQSLSIGSDVKSLIAARWLGARTNRINLVSPDPPPPLSPLSDASIRVKPARPSGSTGSVRSTKEDERYSTEGASGIYREQKGGMDERRRQTYKTTRQGKVDTGTGGMKRRDTVTESGRDADMRSGKRDIRLCLMSNRWKGRRCETEGGEAENTEVGREREGGRERERGRER